jgi:glycogen(starch) synthase
LTLDPETRSAISQRAQERIRSICSPEIVVSQRIEHFQKVIDHHSPRKLFPTAVTANAESLAESENLSSEIVAQHDVASETPRLLSIVVPCYNLGHFLPEVLENLEQTTYRPYEVVIVDDGSTDAESLQIFDKIEAESGEHVRIVHTLNQGLPATRNTGAEHAKGEFVFFLDADDLVEPEFFAKAIDVLDRYENVDFVYPWVRYFEGSQGIWPTWNAEFPYLLGHNMASGGFSVFRRQTFMRHGRNKSEIAYSLEDFEMFVHLVGAGCVGVSLPDPLVRYRVRSDSMWQTSNANMHQLLYDQISAFHKPLYQQWGVELFNLQNANGPGRLWNHPGIEIRQELGPIPHAENGEMQRVVKRLESQINQYQYDLATMKAWAEELERAKRWLAEQSERRQAEIERLQPRADQAEAELAEVRNIVNNPSDLQDWRRRIENMDRLKSWMPSPMKGLLRRVLKWR